MSEVMTGGCQCGAIRYRGDPTVTSGIQGGGSVSPIGAE